MSEYQFFAHDFPASPGCYLMKDSGGIVLYVGKSKNLRSRLSSYFSSHIKNGTTRDLVSRIAEIEIILVNTETESLLLENNLIGVWKPSFNRLLGRGEKGFPYLALTQEAFPRLERCQLGHPNQELGKAEVARLFGPYLSYRFSMVLLDFIRAHYRIRSCERLPREACLRFHLNLCSGPCVGKVTAEEYLQQIEQVVAFLCTGIQTDLIRKMKMQMHTFAENLEFERAQKLKDQIDLLEKALEEQVIERIVDYDQAAVYFGEQKALIATIKKGSLVSIDEIVSKAGTVLSEFLLKNFYPSYPREVIVNRAVDAEEIERLLGGLHSREVRVIIPEQGENKEIIDLLKLNYEYRESRCTQFI